MMQQHESTLAFSPTPEGYECVFVDCNKTRYIKRTKADAVHQAAQDIADITRNVRPTLLVVPQGPMAFTSLRFTWAFIKGLSCGWRSQYSTISTSALVQYILHQRKDMIGWEALTHHIFAHYGQPLNQTNNTNQDGMLWLLYDVGSQVLYTQRFLYNKWQPAQHIHYEEWYHNFYVAGLCIIGFLRPQHGLLSMMHSCIYINIFNAPIALFMAQWAHERMLCLKNETQKVSPYYGPTSFTSLLQRATHSSLEK